MVGFCGNPSGGSSSAPVAKARICCRFTDLSFAVQPSTEQNICDCTRCRRGDSLFAAQNYEFSIENSCVTGIKAADLKEEYLNSALTSN